MWESLFVSVELYTLKNVFNWEICINHIKSVNFENPKTALVHLVLGILEAIPIFGQLISLAEYSIVKLSHLNKTDKKIQEIVTSNKTDFKSGSNSSHNPGLSAVSTVNQSKKNSLGTSKQIDFPSEEKNDFQELLELDVINYIKGETRTRDLKISTKNQKIYGKGAYGEVRGIKQKQEQVLKKTNQKDALRNEFEIAKKIGDHPNFVRIDKLYIKKYPNGRTQEKLLMEKIEGHELTQYCLCEKLSSEEIISYLNTLKDCCVYLFKRGIYWRDLNAGNLMVLKDRSGIKLIDFGYWGEVENSELRAKVLFLGSLEIVGWMLKSSFMRKTSIDREKELGVQYPLKFFEKEVTPPYQTYSLFRVDSYANADWMQLFCEKIKNGSDKEIIKILENYFDCVITKIKSTQKYSIRSLLQYFGF